MKSLKMALILVLVLAGAMASESVLARGHGGHVRFGVFVGGPAFWPGYYYPPSYYYPPYYPSYYPTYYPPAVAAPSYVEQGGAQAAPAPSQGNWWYYCTDAKAYYPYVKECPAGWQRVAPQPAS
jgi:hypothetical protein